MDFSQLDIGTRGESSRRTVLINLAGGLVALAGWLSAGQDVDARRRKKKRKKKRKKPQSCRPGAPETCLVPLKLFYSDEREDNFTTATPEGRQDAINTGYRFARLEGYVAQSPSEGMVPLELFYSEARGDNFTTATPEGRHDALSAGYRFARVEGYVWPER